MSNFRNIWINFICATNISIVLHTWNYAQMMLLGLNAMCYTAVVKRRSQSQGHYFR